MRREAKWITVVVSALALSACAMRGAPTPEGPSQPPPPAPTAMLGEGIERDVYPVELVMSHQAAIALDEAQTSAIRSELQRTQSELVELEWRLHGQTETLAGALHEARVDEPAAVAAAERVARTEGELKLAHLRLLVRVKNLLRPEQRAQLDRLRPTAR